MSHSHLFTNTFINLDGYTGRNLYTVYLTDQAANRLPPLSEFQSTLAEQNLNETDWEVLNIVAEQGPCLSRDILENMSHDIAPMKLIPVVNHLVREEYLREYGLWRRYLETTEEGNQTIEVLGRE